jgi:hypothetical protein
MEYEIVVDVDHAVPLSLSRERENNTLWTTKAKQIIQSRTALKVFE